MRRREFIVGIGWATVTLAPVARAQGSGPIPVIAVLRGGRKDREFHRSDSLTGVLPAALKAMGWEEGRNVRIVHRWAEDYGERLPLLARDLLAERPDVLVTTGDPATKALQAATATVPIITMSDDVIGGGLAASMARPGGNTTGVSILATELDGKRLEILHECVPQRRRIGVLVDATTSSSAKALDSTAHDLGLELLRYAVRNPREIRHVLDEIAAAGLEAINVLASPMFQQARAEIVASLNAARLPAIYQWPDTATEGGLLGYGPRLTLCYRQVASLVSKVLSGAKPPDLPVEQPTKFELVINLKTAKALNLPIPPTLLARADEVIE